jgi:hypothetical protein
MFSMQKQFWKYPLSNTAGICVPWNIVRGFVFVFEVHYMIYDLFHRVFGRVLMDSPFGENP